MRSRTKHFRSEPQFALMLAAAALAHVVVLSLAWGAPHVPPLPSSSSLIELDLSVDLNSSPLTPAGPTTVVAPAASPTQHSLTNRAPSQSAAADAPVVAAGEGPPQEDAPPNPTGPTAPTARKPVRLFLGGDQLSQILKQTTRDVAPSSPDLWQELHTEDAARGLSPASPAVAAAYHAAPKAPREGSARVRVRVDAQGHVTSVQLIGAANRDQWTPLVEELLARLKSTQFRLPPKSAGLELQLRIDRGLVAKDAKDRFKVEPGYALGQEPPPRGIVRDDSARASFEESGRISPTARVVDSTSFHDTSATRVVLEVMKLH